MRVGSPRFSLGGKPSRSQADIECPCCDKVTERRGSLAVALVDFTSDAQCQNSDQSSANAVFPAVAAIGCGAGEGAAVAIATGAAGAGDAVGGTAVRRGLAKFAAL